MPVAKWMARRRPPSQTWRAFLANHVDRIAAADFFVVDRHALPAVRAGDPRP